MSETTQGSAPTPSTSAPAESSGNGAASNPVGPGGFAPGKHPTLEQAIEAMSAAESKPSPQPQVDPASTQPKAEEQKQEPSPDNDKTLAAFERIRLREKQLREREAKIAEIEEQNKRFKQIEAEAKENPLKLLEAFQVSYQQIVDKMIAGDATQSDKDDLQKLRTQIESLNKKLEDKDKADSQRFQTERMERFVNGIRDHTKTKPDEYKLIEHLGMHERVFDHLAHHYQNTGEQLSLEEASRAVESQLRTGLKAEIEKLQKLHELVDPKPTQPPPQSDTASESQPSFSLSDKSFKSGAPTREDTRGLSDQQRFELALRQL